MSCMSFSQLIEWVMKERKTKGTVFGVHQSYIADKNHTLHIFDRKLETPIGPAAGPNSQLAQNIVAAYYAGSRFFELKTVQKMDGQEMVACIKKPCINVEDEGYNCEWSTELTVEQAQDEYIKAWFLLSVIAKEFDLGAMDGFQFNMSVGYDFSGIQSPKVNAFIDHMIDAKNTECFVHCREYLLAHFEEFHHITKEDIYNINSRICNSITISTLHGCPSTEIEKIASYLLTEKKIHTFIKCNPTLLGYDDTRKILDEMGYDYISFGRFHFDHDLQMEDGIPMLQRLMKLSQELNLEFGVKISNTFPVEVKANELPSEQMYLSGKALYVLSMSVAYQLSQAFQGKLRISYSGGADYFNIQQIVACGIWPVTVATTILKPGGYQRLVQLAKLLEQSQYGAFTGIKVSLLKDAVEHAKTDQHYVKSVKRIEKRKNNQPIPLINCYVAPCENACPIHQDIVAYTNLVGQGRMKEAFCVILEKNALPFITSTICAHPCMNACNRNYYDSPVQIRETKKIAVTKGEQEAFSSLTVTGSCGKRVAIIGGGPAGMAAAFYLAKAGAQVTLFEKREALGGVVRYIIPDFRIDADTIEKDVSLLTKLGVTICTNSEVTDLNQFKAEGYDAVILAVGAYGLGNLSLEAGTARNAFTFLEEYNQSKGNVSIGKNVVVIGGGNTAMDTARAAKRCKGVEKVSIIYRRTKRYMPADEEELQLAMKEGIEFLELLAPMKLENGQLFCKKMILGEMEENKRRSIIETKEEVSIVADTVIAAVGEHVLGEFYTGLGLRVDKKGYPVVNATTLESTTPDVYVIGDGLYGPSVVVEVMAHAKKAAAAITGDSQEYACKVNLEKEEIYRKKGILCEPLDNSPESNRCLGCQTVCENCVDVCPNRANISIKVPSLSMEQVIHVDSMCNECGNCNSFCPYHGAPYQDKFTLFSSEEDMRKSTNDGFAVLNRSNAKARVRYMGETFLWNSEEKTALSKELGELIKTICKEYSYLL